MKRNFFNACSGAILLALSFHAMADDNNTSDDSDDDVSTLLTNLGSYLGYELPGQYQGSTPYAQLLNATYSQNLVMNLMYSLFGALPVNAFNTTVSQFIPSSNGSSSNANLTQLNNMANTTFSTAGYNSGGNSSSVGVNPLIDQETYQNDPTNQSILNILGTPDYTYCMNNDASAWLSDCNLLYNYSVINNIVGTVPSPSNFFSYTYNQNVIPQLNGNTLITPLMYDTSTAIGSTGSTGTLNASTQIQEAANFIRYATFGTTPVNLPSYQDYTSVYTTASSTTGAPQNVAEATNAINSYISGLRTYASIASVPTSNLYYILSKRMPQTAPTGNKEQTSQALNEFVMATYRLSSQSPSSGQEPWIKSINEASPATVGKEIAMLLAEINYQLYLNRQQEERQLLTNSLILMIMAREQIPNFNPNNVGSTGSTS